MNDNQDPGLNSIWGSVRSEIGAARRRERGTRIARGVATAAALAFLTTAVIRHSLAPPPEPTSPAGPPAAPRIAICDCQSWQISDVAPAVGIATHYPLIEDKKVFALRGTGAFRKIVCLDKRNGRLRWESTLRFADCRLAVDATRLYALARSTDGPWCCVAFDSGTGRELWRQPEGPFPLLPPSVLALHTNGICWTQGNRAMCRSKVTGERMWEHRVDDSDLLSAPKSHANQILVASHGSFLALDSGDGSVLYSHRLARRPMAPCFAGPILAMHGGRAFVASRRMAGRSYVWCIQPASGQVVWKRRVQTPRALLVSGSQVFIRSTELSVLDAVTGDPLWHTPIGGCGALSVREGRLYLADAEDRSRVLVLDGATGRRLEARPIAGSCNGIVVSGCMGFLSSNDGSLYAFPVDNRS